MRILLLTIIIFFNISHSFSQNLELKVGAKVPDVYLQNILFYPGGKAKLSDFKGKVILLDFWSTSCAPCIEGLPKMDSLQRKYKDKLMILPVHPFKKIDSRIVSNIDSFWRHNKYSSKTKLPTIIDTALYKMFGFRVAYQVWIDQDMILRAKSTEQYVNDKEIGKFLKREYPDWELATKEFYNFDIPLVSFNNKNEDKVSTNNFCYSAFRNYLPGNESGKSIISDSGRGVRYTAINLPISSLYKEVMFANLSNEKKENEYWGVNRIIYEIQDSSRIFLPKGAYSNEWLRKNSFCYEVFIPNTFDKKKLYNYLQRDLDKYLGLNSKFENREMNCLVIEKLLYNESNSLNTEIRYLQESYIEQNIPTLKDLIEVMSNQSKMPLIISDVKANEEDLNNFRFLLQKNLGYSDIDAIRNELKRKGYNIEYKKRNRKVFVVSEN